MDFFDSVNPALIPYGAAACIYWDGDFAAAPTATARFTRVRWITVLGDWRAASIADFEAGNEVFIRPGALVDFVEGRHAIGKRAIVYCDRDNLPLVRELLQTDKPYQVWIGTLDGNKLSADWTPDLWGVQYLGGQRWDKSILYAKEW